jgi:hypothetical protein
MVHAIQTSPSHVIITLRAKTEYAKEQGENGKTTIKKLGMAPEMRDNFAYEFDVEGMLSIEHDLAVGKTRCDLIDGKVFHKPGADLAGLLNTWLTSGAPVAPVEPAAQRLRKLLEAADSKEALDTARAAVTEAKAQLSRQELTDLAAVLKAADERLAAA